MIKKNRPSKYKIMIIALGLLCAVAMLIYGITFATVILIGQMIALLVLYGFKRLSIRRKTYKVIYRLLSLGMVLWLTSFVAVQGLIYSGFDEQPDKESYDFILILGAGLRGEEPSTILRLRLEAAALVAARYPDIPIIVSGGQGPGETVTEAVAMHKYLVEHGVDRERFILEDRATSTYENFLFSEVFIDELTQEDARVLVITNEFHMFRSMKLAERVGLEADGYAVKTPLGIRLNYLVREYFAVVNSLVLTGENLDI